MGFVFTIQVSFDQSPCSESVPHIVQRALRPLRFRFVTLTRDTLGSELVKTEDLAIDDAKEESWMAVYKQCAVVTALAGFWQSRHQIRVLAL